VQVDEELVLANEVRDGTIAGNRARADLAEADRGQLVDGLGERARCYGSSGGVVAGGRR